jgi:hypothetical protein
MSAIKQLTITPPEAALEVRLASAVRATFHWLPPDSLSHQTKFQFKFGHSIVKVDGAAASKVQGRLDILVSYKGEPLAVMELKRETLSLTSDDEDQGLSYARMLHPRPPLVVVTNGKETKTLETHTGAEWKPDTPSEAAVQKLIQAAGTLAAGTLKRAIETLLGPQSDVWIEAIRATTDSVLVDLSGGFDEISLPFVDGFLIPRNATQQVLDELKGPKRIVLVEGAPLIGKSNVLRELALSTRTSPNFVTLFIEADGQGVGIFQSIADLMADALGWTITTDDARAWLRSLSRQSGSTLVLAIDGISATRNEVRRDIEELTSDSFGKNLRLVLAVDDAIVPDLLKSASGRKATKIGRRAGRVSVDTLADDEFRGAIGVLHERRIVIMKGGEFAPEFRLPWVLRALASNVVTSPKYADENLLATLPPLLGLDLLTEVRERFEGNEDIRHVFHGLAEAVLEDSADRKRPVSTVLESMESFVVGRTTLRKYMDGSDLARTADRGLVKLASNAANDAIVIPALPELLTSELASLIAQKLGEVLASEGPEDAADWLVARTSNLPFGDVIGAQAICDYATDTGNMPLDFIERLLAVPPRREKIKPGTKFALFLPNVGKIELMFRDDGRIVARAGVHQKVLDVEESDEFSQEMYADIEGWLILSHLAGRPYVAVSKDGTHMGRVDPALLLEVGTCPIVLRRPLSNPEMDNVLVHDIKDHGSIVCHKMGIVEPIAMSMLRFLSRPDFEITDWFEDAVARNSFPLMCRIDIALSQLMHGGARSTWAGEMRDRYVAPALAAFPPEH